MKSYRRITVCVALVLVVGLLGAALASLQVGRARTPKPNARPPQAATQPAGTPTATPKTTAQGKQPESTGSTGIHRYKSKPYRILKSDKAQTKTVAFSGDGKLLATGTADTVEVWDIAANKVIATFIPQDGPVRSRRDRHGIQP